MAVVIEWGPSHWRSGSFAGFAVHGDCAFSVDPRWTNTYGYRAGGSDGVIIRR